MYLHLHLALGFLAFLFPLVFSAPTCGLSPPKETNTSSSSTTGCNTLAATDAVLTGWYPGWLGNQFPPQNLSWSKYTALTFAFAVTTPDGGVSLDDVSTQVLPEFVASAKQHNVEAHLSIGGWTGSRYFSSAVSTAESRTAFVKTIVDLVNQYDLDGIDFDWEYPNKQGIGCNQISSNDASNYLAFLQELRKDSTGSKITLSAAVGIAPFVGSNGTPMTDVSGFADVLDHIAIMNYDVWGSWSSTVGPNSPLDDACAPTKAGSAVSAVKAWTDAGFPANQIALGVAAYGHSFHVSQQAALGSQAQSANLQDATLQLYPAFDKALQPHGDSQDGAAGQDECGNQVPVGGIFNFWGLVDGGFLNQDGTADTGNGIVYRYDNCSQTPFVYSPTSQVMVSYDDKTSFAAKGKWIEENGLKGFAMWHVLGDFDDILLDSISEAMGVEVEQCGA